MTRSRRLRDEPGLTVIEMAVVVALFMIVLTAIGAAIFAAQRTTRFGQQESEALDAGRTALARVERDIRSARAFAFCASGVTGDDCLLLTTQLASGVIDRVRYRTDNGGTALLRDTGCESDFSDCDSTQTLLTNLALAPTEDVFTCASGVQPGTAVPTHAARIEILFRMSPLATITGGTGTLVLETTARPRNLVQQCP